jgi:anti-sigma-K factor RskA
MDYSRPELADRIAADYVSGTLRGAARRRVEQLLPAHPVLRDAVRRWEAALMPLTGSVAPQPPSPAVWQRISSRIGGAPVVVADTPWWSNLSLLRTLSFLSVVAVVGLSALLSNPPPAKPPLIVVLNSTTPTDGLPAGTTVPPAIIASVSGDGKAVVTRTLADVGVKADRTLELWAVPGSGSPRSLGLIAASGASVVKQSKLPPGTAALAVSLEPAGGSTTGVPTGPVLYVGKLAL